MTPSVRHRAIEVHYYYYYDLFQNRRKFHSTGLSFICKLEIEHVLQKASHHILRIYDSQVKSNGASKLTTQNILDLLKQGLMTVDFVKQIGTSICSLANNRNNDVRADSTVVSSNLLTV